MRCATVLLGEMLGLEHVFPLRLADVADADVVDVLADELPKKTRPRDAARSGSIRVNQITRLPGGGSFDVDREVPVKEVALHLLAEAARVRQARAALEAGDGRAFGKILDAAHDSLRQEMRMTTPAEDRLGAVMRRAGAFGASRAGDGFVLAACHPDRVDAVVEAAAGVSHGAPAFPVHVSEGVHRCQ
ncbi:MAG: hypothetical protein U5Q44_12715 [Dehalococcoidia bacterium]|nr:hypothetical protein [Dehalococcoidia bacterium]